jgi:hypothetical protein
MTCASSWLTRAKVTTALLGSNATCTNRQTALGARGSQTAGYFETSETAEPASASRDGRHIKLQVAPRQVSDLGLTVFSFIIYIITARIKA